MITSRTGKREGGREGKIFIKNNSKMNWGHFPSLNGRLLFYQQRLEALGVILSLSSFPSSDIGKKRKNFL